MEKEKALQHYIQSQKLLKTALESIPDDKKDIVLVEGNWKIKELLCHFIGWDQSLLAPLKVFITTGDFPVEVIQDHDSYNALMTSSRQDWPLTQVIEESIQTSQQLLELVAGLDQSQCNARFSTPWGGEGTIPDMLAGLAWHVNEHLKSLNTALSKS